MNGNQLHSPGRSSQDDLTLWRKLATSGREATAEALTESDFERLHIETGIELFVSQQVQEGKSIVVTGNAGDGKTHLLRRVKQDLDNANAVVINDATAEMRGGKTEPILNKWNDAINNRRPFCMAVNEYPLYQLKKEGSSISHVQEIEKQGKNRLSYNGSNFKCKGDVVVIDLSLRNPLSGNFFNLLINKLLNEKSLKTSQFKLEEPVAIRNVEMLTESRVLERLKALANRLVALGYRATVRELWIFFARMVFGTACGKKDCRKDWCWENWYSTNLFVRDDRINLSIAIQNVDPAGCSHPVWDDAIDTRKPAVSQGWILNVPFPKAHPTLEWELFAALKRRFYFEHEQGEKIFDLDDPDEKEFHNFLDGEKTSDPAQVEKLIYAINAAFCPFNFNFRNQYLYLWNGHRFHEQPTRSFTATKRISSDKFIIEIPRLPDHLRNSFDYVPDHIVLTQQHPGNNEEQPRLRIDFALWKTLKRLERGLPRKLIPERDIHRLDAFLQKLGTGIDDSYDTVWSVHLENLQLIEVNLSSNKDCYERVRVLYG